MSWVTELGTEGEWSVLEAYQDGGVVAVGFVNSLTVGGDTLSGQVVLRLSPSGGIAWARGLGDLAVTALAVLNDGRIVLGGSSDAFFNAPEYGVSGPGGFYVVLAADGSPASGRSFGAEDTEVGAVVAAETGGFYLSGHLRNASLDLGNGSVQVEGHRAFAVRYTPDTDIVWQRLFGDGGEFLIHDAVEDPTGRLVLTGSTLHVVGIDLGGGFLEGNGAVLVLAGDGGYDESVELPASGLGLSSRLGEITALMQLESPQGARLQRFDAELTEVDVTTFTGSDPWLIGRPLSTDPFGNMLYAGGATDFGEGIPSGPAISVAKLRPDASVVWSHQVESGIASPPSVAAGASSLFVAGVADAGTDIDGTVTTSQGMFIASFEP